jgi:hypothetical protein
MQVRAQNPNLPQQNQKVTMARQPARCGCFQPNCIDDSDISSILDSLKASGHNFKVYDQSNMVLQSDHSSSEYSHVWIATLTHHPPILLALTLSLSLTHTHIPLTPCHEQDELLKQAEAEGVGATPPSSPGSDATSRSNSRRGTARAQSSKNERAARDSAKKTANKAKQNAHSRRSEL